VRNIIFAVLFLALASVVRADSIDESEAQRRGVSVQVIQLERAKQRIADLEKQVAELKQQLAASKDDKNVSAATTATAPAQTASKESKKDVVGDTTPTPSTPSVSGSSGKTVHVNGYTRKDGTYVRPYNRRPPSK
jgi:uncharacterized membrane protein